MATGTIKQVTARGYGFITPDKGGEDVFFHASSLVEGIGFEDLHEKQKVEYTLVKAKKGFSAENVNVIG